MTQYLAYDIGGTNIKYALMDQKGHTIEKGSVPSERIKDDDQISQEDHLQYFMDTMYKIGDKYAGQFDGIAVCAPGKIDTKKTNNSLRRCLAIFR